VESLGRGQESLLAKLDDGQASVHVLPILGQEQRDSSCPSWTDDVREDVIRKVDGKRLDGVEAHYRRRFL